MTCHHGGIKGPGVRTEPKDVPMTKDNISQIEMMFSEFPITDDQRRNPVYQTLLNIKKNNLINKDEFVDKLSQMMLYGLTKSIAPADKEMKKFIDLKYKGKDVMHQALEYISKFRSGLWSSDEALKQCDVNPVAIRIINNLATKCFSKDVPVISAAHFMQVISSLTVPIPYDTCSYSRLTPKATEYLLSLGAPSKDTVEAFLEDCRSRSNLCRNGAFEEVVTLVLNGKTTAIYYMYQNDLFYSVRFIKDSASEEISWCFTSDFVPDANTYYNDNGVEDDVHSFDIRALVVNLWAARTTKAFSDEYEPSENRPYVEKTCGPHKANFKSYRYVKITPEGESQYNESKRIISQVRADAEYRKSVWFTRAYYARRGADKVVTYCKASMHHRKCAPVTEGSTVTIYS